MNFDRDTLEKLQKWESVQPGFCRDDQKSVREYIEPFIDYMNSKPKYQAQVYEYGGLSNHYEIFIIKDRSNPIIQKIKRTKYNIYEGTLVYINLSMPVYVLGRSRHFVYNGGMSWGTIEKPEDVLNEIEFSDLENKINEYFKKTPYILLSKEEVSQKLPDDIVPWEYYVGPEPWDKLFHLLFSSSD